MSNAFGPPQQQPFYQQPQQPPAYLQQEPPKQSGSGCLWAGLIGCGGALLLSIVACVGIGYYIQQNVDKWVVGLVREGIVAVIEESELEAGEKTEVIAQVDRVVNAYKARKINQQDLERVMEELGESPVFLLLPVWGMEKQYFDQSGLTEDEKQAGRQAFARAYRGVFDEKISEESLQAVLPDPYAGMEEMSDEDFEKMEDMDFEPEPRKLTDEEVRKLIADVKKLADDAGIPDAPVSIDIGDEVKKAVDKALAGKDVP
jgi:hypothetical protein